MKLNIQSYTINKPTNKQFNNSKICLTNNKKYIFIGRSDGNIDILNNKDLKPLYIFQSHMKTYDILQNSEISPSIQCIKIYDNGLNYENIYTLNENFLKIWNIKLNDYDNKKIKKNNLLNIPNFFQYTANSLNINNEYILGSDFLNIKYFSINNLLNPILLINNKPKNLNYDSPLNLINKSNFIDYNTFAYCCTNGLIYLNDLRTNINSTNLLTFNHKLNLEKSKYSDLLHSVSDFKIFNNLLYARNLNSIISFDLRKGFLERKLLFNEVNLFKNDNKIAYERYNIDLFNGKIITGMLNTINIIDSDHHIIKLPDGGANKFLKNINDNRFCSFYMGKLLFFKPK